jgi:hypothetical protein
MPVARNATSSRQREFATRSGLRPARIRDTHREIPAVAANQFVGKPIVPVEIAAMLFKLYHRRPPSRRENSSQLIVPRHSSSHHPRHRKKPRE